MKPFTIHDQNNVYFLTWTTVDWIDIFTRQCYRDIVIESLKYCIQNKGLALHAYVIISNHIHLIARVDRVFDFLTLFGIARNLRLRL
jgi:REP element-mobilizing transposase RayT